MRKHAFPDEHDMRTAMDCVRFLVRDLNAKLLIWISFDFRHNPYIRRMYLFNRHDNFNGIQTVQAQIVRKVRCIGELYPFNYNNSPSSFRGPKILTFVASWTYVCSACVFQMELRSHLVKVFEYVHYAPLDFSFRQSSWSRVKP